MRTEEQVKTLLKSKQRENKATEKRFDKYDNAEDMELIVVEEAWIAALNWVLAE